MEFVGLSQITFLEMQIGPSGQNFVGWCWTAIKVFQIASGFTELPGFNAGLCPFEQCLNSQISIQATRPQRDIKVT